MNTTFYIIHKLDSEIDKDGRHLQPGYYRYTYNLSGVVDMDRPCEYSVDRDNWECCGLFKSLSEFQDCFVGIDTFKIELEDYVETITYKGVSVPVFLDDYGQCFYCIFNNKVLGFGSFQSEYEDELKDIIDYDLSKRHGNED